MVAGRNQRWITSARNDDEAWKCILLARSIRETLTTRPVGVFISDHVSEELREKLEDEFDICSRIGERRLKKQYPGLAFSSAAKLSSWNIQGLRKFIFLDCDSLMIKNSDVLFRKNGMRLMNRGAAGCRIGLLIGNCRQSQTGDNKEQKIIRKWENGTLSEDRLLQQFPELDNCYGVDMLWGKHGSTPVNGKEWKIVTFSCISPMDLAKMQTNGFEYGTMDKAVLQICRELLPEKSAIPEMIGGAKISSAPDLSNSIAIVGMACRFPGANNIDEFWKLLEEGREGICKVPEGRWTKDNSVMRLTDVRNTEAGFLACPIDRFDAKFFNINSADMAFMDPQQRLTLKIVWESLEHAGIDPDLLKNSLTGVFGGWWRNDYKEMLQQVGIINESEFFRAYMGNALGNLTARVSHFFELVGPSVSTESGCSTSIVGVDTACDSLRNENCDIALAVGANLLLHPFSVNLMNTVIAMDGRCKTFDADADGFGRAEGVAALVLKRYPDAVAAGDRIWGLIRGSAVVQEGTSKSMGTPTVDSEALAMELALERAGVHPKDVSFVETHGTGTPVGDPLEMAAVAKVYSKGRKEVLTLGSVKTNIGHTESTCGIAGIIKTVLSMKHGLIPKHLNFNNLNPDINLTAIPAQLPLEAIEWTKRDDGTPRIAGVSSFGITGTDAHLILQETPNDLKYLSIPEMRPIKFFTLSGKSEDSLALQLKAYRDFIPTTSFSLEDIEFTQHTGRSHFPFRKAILARSSEELVNELDSELALPPRKMKPVENCSEICFLFTGQGSQYPGMAKSLYEGSLVFQTHFDQCDSILGTKYGFRLKDVLWGQRSALLKRTLYSQTSIFCVEYCLLKLWEAWGIMPTCVVGHSLGEYAAAVAAGMLTFEDALLLVVTRSKLIDDLPNASMIVVGASLATVENVLKQVVSVEDRMWLDVAAVNTNEQTVLAGPTEFVQRFTTYCENNNLKSHILEASHAFHSRLMDPMLEKYRTVAETVSYHEPKNCKFISGMKGQVVTKVNGDYWVRHTVDRVRFMDASKAALMDGNSQFLEIGPHPVLTAMIMINSDSVDLDEPISCHASLRRKTNDWDTILTTLSKLYTLGFLINWDNFHRFSQAKKVDLPGYIFTEKQYWLSIQDDGSVPFHPLVGGRLPNPSPTKLFKNDLYVTRVPFLKDHALGDKLIFPGAGYLEMCLTAGYAAISCPEGSYTKPSSGVSVRNFCIDSPVCLNEKSSTEFQVVVTKGDESGDALSTVHTKLYLDSNNFKWIRHASAKVQLTPHSQVDNPSLDVIMSRCTEPVSSCHDYKEIEELGYNFGPSFKTLKAAWTASDESLQEFLFEFKSSENPEPFTVHPCVIDAMFQAQILSLGLKMKKLNSKTMLVPLQIENFTCWSPLNTQSGYIFVTPSKTNGEKDVHLFARDGSLVATMIGTEFVETTLNNLMALIESQRNPYPSMYTYAWRESLGPCERRALYDDFLALKISETDSYKFNTKSPEEKDFYHSSHKLYGLYMIQALVKLGIENHINTGDHFQWPQIGEKLNIVPGLQKYLRYLLMTLGEDGWFEIRDASSPDKMVFKYLKPFPTLQHISSQIEYLKNDIRRKELGIGDIKAVDPLGGNLAEILSGNLSALSILFPEGTNVRGPAELYYTDSTFFFKGESLVQYYIPQFVSNLQNLPSSSASNSKPVLRILEVGAGTGSATKAIIPCMISSKNSTKYEYTYTDTSSVFLHKGEELFQNIDILTKFEILNIEQDPLTQGFIPEHYDVIIAAYVVHATRDIKETILHMKKLLKPSGNLILFELTHPDRAINLLFGGLEQFWSSTDTSLRPYGCELSEQRWEQTLQECGFVDFSSMNYCNSKFGIMSTRRKPSTILGPTTILDLPLLNNSPTWVVFGNNNNFSSQVVAKLQQWGRKVILVTIDQLPVNDLEDYINGVLNDTFSKCSHPEGIAYLWGLNNDLNYQDICEPYLYIGKYLSRCSAINVRLVTFTTGNLRAGSVDVPFNQPDSSPIIAMTTAMMNEIHGLVGKCVDVDPCSIGVEDSDVYLETFSELFTVDQEAIVAYRKNRRLVPRLQPYKIKNTGLELPAWNRYQVILPTSNVIPDIRFAPLKPEVVRDGEIEVEVRAYALNFKDLLVITKPDPVFELFTMVGIDFAGVVTRVGTGGNDLWKIGDRVFGARNEGSAMPSHVITKPGQVSKIPGRMTFSDASTLPVAFTTVSYCLLNVAKIKEGEVVLIHTGSGGVGLAAIMVAQWRKCKIIATAGSKRKRKYLRNLGVEHVFNSRTTEYEARIKEILGGRGVDVVLNSLTGPGFKEATLAVCAEGARFVEMSKMNIWSKEEVQALRPDVMYDIADLWAMSEDELLDQFKHLKEDMDSGDCEQINPLPYTKFELSEIREAFEYMQEAKHIGKIVITMPETGGKISSEAESKMKMFNENATYMITGGLGGIGLEVAKWMSRNGAKYILLVGRSPPTAIVEQQLAEIRSRGIRVIVQKCDVGNFEECKILMQNHYNNDSDKDDVSSNPEYVPPIRGIMHAAGVLSDGILEGQTWESLETVFNAKIRGSWNLHQLTTALPYPLEHFVMFSSVASTFGSIGQVNHAAGNCFLDSLAHYRNFCGLPATTINWGQWGGVGVAANLNVAGLTPFTVFQGLSALEVILKSNKTQVVVCEGEVGLATKVFSSAKKFLSELDDGDSNPFKELDGEAFWQEYDTVESREDQCAVVRKYIKTILRLNLKMDKNEEIDDQANFQDLGMDSLMMVEMKNALQTSVGKRVKISIASVKDCKTVNQLSLRLVELISGKVELPPPTREELRDLILEDSILPESISPTKSSITEMKTISNISTVLVTGATGTLGPYVVCEILKQPSIQKVYCLMRENKLFPAAERFTRIFKEKKLLSCVDTGKIEFVVGDVSEANLGLNESDYNKLASNVDAIFNVAVKSNWEEYYFKSDNPKHSRNVNVTGIKNVLTLAVERRLKYVYHASTMIAETQVDQDGRFWEDWPIEGEFDNQINSAYAISKYICDRLVKQAVDRGIPCKAFRFPNIGGDSVNGGNFQIMDSFLMIRMLAYMYLGFMPAQNVPMTIMPVDLCAKFSVQLFFNEESGFEMFNVANPIIFDEREFDDVAEEFGVELDVVDPDEFFEKLKNLDSNDDVLQIVKLALTREQDRQHMEDNMPELYTNWLRGDKNILLSRKLSLFLPNEYPNGLKSTLEILTKDLQYAKDTGVFDKFGIKYTESESK